MKNLQLLFITILAVLLVGCGFDHKGTWISEANVMGMKVNDELILGSNFMQNGNSKEMVEFKEVERDGKKFLQVLNPQTKSVTDEFIIIDDNTLVQDLGLAKLTLKRK